MAKTTKKKNRKLRRQIRKTIGALLMISGCKCESQRYIRKGDQGCCLQRTSYYR